MKTTRCRRAGHAGAFTLVEMLVFTLLLGVFMLIIGELFTVTNHAQQDAKKRDSLFHRLDSAVAHLRRDTWAAARIDADGDHMKLPPPEGPVVIWRCSPNGTLSRTTDPASTVESWGNLPPVAFSARGSLLTVTLKAVDHSETVTFVSQEMEGGGK